MPAGIVEINDKLSADSPLRDTPVSTAEHQKSLESYMRDFHCMGHKGMF
jgi:hypothetical protein